MRFLVLGSSGMAGHMICQYLAERGYEVTGLSRSRCPRLHEGVRQVAGDVGNLPELERRIVEGGYDVVVNAVGVLNAACDERPDVAVYINSYLPHRLAAMTEDAPTRVFHLSTDCVFAGNAGPYREGSVPDGRTLYDRTKALGEVIDSKNLTLRQSIVGPDTKPQGIGLLNWFMAQKGTVKGFSRAIWTGMTTLELAKAVEACARDGSAGLVNMVPEGPGVSKLDLLGMFNDEFRGGAVKIVPDSALVLDKTLVRANFGPSFRPAPYDVQVRELAEWTRGHMDLYPHYREAMGL